MRWLPSLGLGILLVCTGCGGGDSSSSGSSSSSSPPASAADVHAPPGDPATLPKVPADAAKIAVMLRERFSEPVVRNVRVDIQDQNGGATVSMTGEVPNEEIRQAVMKEVETRVDRMKNEDFNLEIAGPIPMLWSFPGVLDTSTAVVFSPDLSLAITDHGAIYETATGRRLNRIAKDGNTAFKCLAISSDGKLLATGYDNGQIAVWDLPLARTPHIIQPPKAPEAYDAILAIAFTHDSKQLATINRKRGEVREWDLSKGFSKLIGSHLSPSDSRGDFETYEMAVSPDDKLIASQAFGESQVWLWDVGARALKETLLKDNMASEVLTFSHDGKTLAAGRHFRDPDNALALYDIATKQTRFIKLDRSDLFLGVAFSPDDRTVALMCQNEGVQLFDAASGKPWLGLDAKKVEAESRQNGIAFSADGTVLATACDSQRPAQVRLWDVLKRPGGGSAIAKLPSAYDKIVARDDLLEQEMAKALRGTFDPSNVKSLAVEALPDGSVRLTGKVQYQENKDVMGRDANTFTTDGDEVGYPHRKVINELRVVGDGYTYPK